MSAHSHMTDDRKILSKEEARQANDRTGNYRVLISSLSIAAVIGIIMVGYFWMTTY